MVLNQYEHDWNVEALFDGVIWCPCCGCPDFTLVPGMGFWCDDCNTQATLRFPGGDDGFIIDFDDSARWLGDNEPLPGGAVHAKVLGTRSPELYWWGTPNVDGERQDGWEPAPKQAIRPLA
jgi:hypothetical protein